MEIIPAESGITVHIHYIEKSIHGNGIGTKVYGELLTYGDKIVYAYELKLNTLEDFEALGE